MRLLAVIGFLAIIAGIAAAGFFFLGFYNIAASQDDPQIVAWALPKVRDASIDRYSAGLAPPPAMSLDDAAVIQAGARAFSQRGCTNCHGGPGVDWAKFSEGLHPDPPDLKDAAGDEPRMIFWVIKNGINMTAMPSFGKIGVDDKEIWSIVAFIKKWPTVTPENYKAWSAP
ncbi:MAG TPA: cytochrome c [Xanthobacteraceae bacterium]|jgi:mono/diheme cytochrome c family protein